jgi:hypothetical protein
MASNALTFKIGADTANMQRGLSKAKTAVSNLKPAMAAFAAAGAAAFATLGVAAAGVKKALDMGGLLSDVAGQTGMTAGKVMLLRTAFDQAGIGADQVGPAINRMQKSLADAASGSGPAAEALGRLGLSAKNLGSMSPDKALKAIGEAINSIGNPTERAATAMEIFGRSGGKMLTLFGDSGALATAADTIGAQAGIMEKNAGVFDRTSDLISATSNKLQGVFVGMAESIAPAILPLLERFNQMDFTAVGQQMGNAASMFIQAMTDGSIWSIMGDSIRISLGNAVNYFYRYMVGVFTAIGRYLPENFKNAVSIFSILTKADFWKGMLNAYIGIAQTFGAKLLSVVAEALKMFAKIPGLGGLLDRSIASLESAGANLQNSGSQNLAAGGDMLSPFFDEVKNRITSTLSAIGEGFTEGFSGAGNVFDLSGVQANLDATFDRLGNTVESLKTQAQAAFPAPNSPGGLQAAFGAIAERNEGGGLGPAGKATNQPLFASSLAKIGGGGGIAGGPAAMLDESRKQTRVLLRIAEGITKFNPSPLLA